MTCWRPSPRRRAASPTCRASASTGSTCPGLDLRKLKLQSSRINHAKFVGSNLDGVVLDQAWALNSDFTNASFKGASLFSTQFRDAKMDGANFEGARVAADFTRASLKGANFKNADLSADMKNQSMGLMRGVFRSTEPGRRHLRERQPRPRGDGVCHA